MKWKNLRLEEGRKLSPKKRISTAVIHRLPKYYRHLGELIDTGVQRISSRDLSLRMRVTASQIRQDLNHFGGFGQQGYGYNVNSLYNEIGKILGLGKIHNIVIVGGGNLGHALAHYQYFRHRGFHIIGVFDKDEARIGKEIGDIKIMDVETLPTFIKENNVEIGAIAIPKSEAKHMAELLVENGVKQIWNFAHLDLHLGDDVIVENVNLTESLMRLSFRAALEQKK